MTAKILNDSVFVQYGGIVGTSLDASRDVAYEIAEELVEQYLGTPLVRSQQQATFPYVPLQAHYTLPHLNVVSLDSAYVYVATGSASGVALYNMQSSFYLSDADHGIVFNGVQLLGGYMGLNICFEYTTGYLTGTFTADSKAMWALVQTAQLVLNELIEPGLNEVVGVQKFSNMKYTEERVKLYQTIFGSTPRANLIVTLLQPKKKMRVGRV